ncbi:MAG: hypothetical protein Q4B70_06175, partial [Lachnospiraceae bacterium]|nr:hypothetical protein [Lachnospiraceae bacterium]
MRFAVFLILFVFSVIIILSLGQVLLVSYENRLWEQKVSAIESKSDMVADRIAASGFQFGSTNESLATEVEQFASLMEGRIMVVDQNYRIVKDTFEIEDNRYLMTEEVIRIMSGEEVAPRTINDQYLEVLY